MSTNRARPPSDPAAHWGREPKETEFSLHQSPGRTAIDVERLQADLRTPRHRVMTATLEYLACALTCSVYIEDIHGHLLFAPSRPTHDDWRQDFTPLSTPAAPGFSTALENWRKQSSAYAALTGDRSVKYQRTVVPLVYHGTAFAFVHFVNSTSSGSSAGLFSEQLTAMIADKLYMLFFGEMNEHREKTVHHSRALRVPLSMESVRSHASEASEASGPSGDDQPSHSICFKTVFHLPAANPVVDYSSIARRVGWSLVRQIEAEWPEIVASHVSAVETASDVELSIHARATPVPDLSSAAAVARRALLQLQWNLKIGIGSAIADGAAAESSAVNDERASREAGVILALADRASPGTQQVLTRREAPASTILLFRDDSQSFRAYAAFIAQELERAEPELVTTARTYALSDCNASATAEMLQVDRRTVSDRLHRISHLTGLEIPSFASKVIIYLAFISPASRY